MLESQGAVPQGTACQDPGRPGDSALSPGNGFYWEVYRVRLARDTQPSTGGASGGLQGAEGWCQGHEPGLCLTPRLLWPDPTRSSINACLQLLSRPFSDSFESDRSAEKASFVLKFTEII